MTRLAICIILIYNGLVCFSQDFAKLVSENFYNRISKDAYSEIFNCKPDSSYDYMHLHFAGQPHEHIKIINLFCQGIRIQINPRLGNNDYNNITTIFIESKQSTLLVNYFNALYRIDDFENIKNIYRKEINGKKIRLISRTVVINLKKEKGKYRIKDIRIKQPNIL